LRLAIEPLAFVQKDEKAVVTNRFTGKFSGRPIELGSSSHSTVTKLRRWKSSNE
jgi:hypothetical protein